MLEKVPKSLEHLIEKREKPERRKTDRRKKETDVPVAEERRKAPRRVTRRRKPKPTKK